MQYTESVIRKASKDYECCVCHGTIGSGEHYSDNVYNILLNNNLQWCHNRICKSCYDRKHCVKTNVGNTLRDRLNKEGSIPVSQFNGDKFWLAGYTVDESAKLKYLLMYTWDKTMAFFETEKSFRDKYMDDRGRRF